MKNISLICSSQKLNGNGNYLLRVHAGQNAQSIACKIDIDSFLQEIGVSPREIPVVNTDGDIIIGSSSEKLSEKILSDITHQIRAQL